MATTTAATYEEGFRSLDREVALDRLAVRGELPPWLEGTLLRTGPARYEHGDLTVNHWFDGLAMLHKFGFADGAVSYANRFLHSQAYLRSQATGRLSYSEFATDPCRSIFGRAMALFQPQATDNANVNVTRLGDRFVAMTETPLPVAFDPETLDTLGVAYRSPGHVTTAHPHGDRESGELLNYATRLGPRSTYVLYGVGQDGARRELASLPVAQPSYTHSFALTERWIVLAEFPLVVRFGQLAAGKPFMESFAWRPERGTSFLVVDRADGSVRGRWRGPPLFAFHHVNAYEQDDRLVLDLCAYDDATIVREFLLQRLRDGTATIPDSTLRRCTIDLAGGGGVSVETLSEAPFELPRINYGAVNGRPYRYAYGAARRPGAGPHEWISRLVKLDVSDGSDRGWSADGCFPGEPVFVAAPTRAAEDDGVCLSVVLDAARGTSFLLVLDAGSFEELARAEVPHAIPYGFHGQFERRRAPSGAPRAL